MSYNKLLEQLCKNSLGKIVIWNILSALEENLLDKNTVKRILGNYYDAYKNEEQCSTAEQLIGILEDVMRGDKPDSDKKKSFQLQCPKKTLGMNGTDSVSNVKRVRSLKRYLDDAVCAYGHTNFLSNPDPEEPGLKEAIEGLNTKGDEIYRGVQLRGKKSKFFWITKSKILSDECRKVLSDDKLADAVRDRLGLINFSNKNEPLVEICIPWNRIKNRRHSRPTFADAGRHPRFRTNADGSWAKHRPGWGNTVDLGRLRAGDAIIDGALERVVEPTDFNVHLGAEFCYLGSTSFALDTSDQANQEFADRICKERSGTDLLSELLDKLR